MEYIVTTLGLLLSERIVDYVVRRNKTTKELIRKAARAAFDASMIIHGDNRDDAFKLFRNLVESGLRAVNIKMSPTVNTVTETIFNELWEARKRGLWDVAMAELNTAGNRGMKIGAAMQTGKPFKVAK